MTSFDSTQAHDRPIYNYALPDQFYYESLGRFAHGRSADYHLDSIPRSTYVNLQELMVASSPLSPPADEYAFPTAPFIDPYGMTVDGRDLMEYPTALPRKQSAPAAYCPAQGQKMAYTLEHNNSRRGNRASCPNPHNLNLNHHYPISNYPQILTPPLSPNNSIPAPPLTPTSQPPTPQLQLELQLHTQPHTHPAQTQHSPQPHHLPSSPSFPHSSTHRHSCLQSACLDPTGRPLHSFSRRADLMRHINCAHSTSGKFSCPRPNCERKGSRGFTRKDHLIEHRRGYHGENIPKRGGRSGARKLRKSKL